MNLKNPDFVFILCLVLFFSVIFLSACTNSLNQNTFSTFIDSGEPICKVNGKPAVFLFSTSWCPHCVWVSPAFEEIAGEYRNAGKIHAFHWELDKEDDTLTDYNETEVPPTHLTLFTRFSPDAGVPVFVFGCKYYRIGNAFEEEDNLEAEKKEFRLIIEKLLE
jgi:thiol-disulfide isomerase/thioredoxin